MTTRAKTLAAFPFKFTDTSGALQVHTGLNQREYFAAHFMAAMVANPVYDALEACIYAERAVMYADQLLAELSKGERA